MLTLLPNGYQTNGSGVAQTKYTILDPPDVQAPYHSSVRTTWDRALDG